MKHFVGIIALTLLIGIAKAEEPKNLTWKTGFAKHSITPKQPMWMSGYASRTEPASGKETDLWAKTAVLQDAQGKTLVLVTLDLVGIDRDTSQRACELIMKKYALPRDAVALSTSHTHCGPVVGTNLRSMYFIDDEQSRRIDEYTEQLPAEILKSVELAMKNLQPTQLLWGVGNADFAVNRRENVEQEVPNIRASGKELKGPVDHSVPVLVAKNGKNEVVGIVFGYACHATTLSFQKWCGDYPGFAMIKLEKAYPQAVALFFAGCGADQNPIPRRTIDLAQKYGDMLATAVAKVVDKPMEQLPAKIASTYKEIDLPLSELPTREELIKQSMDENRYVAARAKMLLDRIAKGGDVPADYPYPVQVWRLGDDRNLVIIGGEVVVDYSLRLKKELGEKTWVMGYANDVMAYIPSLRVLKEGGYEGARSMIYYGLPSTWADKVEEMIITEVRRQVEGMQNR